MKLDGLLSYYHQYKMILFPVAAGVVTILIGYFVIYYQISLYLKRIDEANRLQDRIGRLNSKVKSLATLDTSNLQGQLAVTLDALPPDKDLAKLMGTIQSLAAQNNIILVTATLGQSSGDIKNRFNPFIMRLEVGGGKEDYKKFINGLENTSRVMKVINLDLSPSVASGSGNASGDATLEVYFAPTPSEVGAVDAPLPTISDKEQQIITDLSSQTVAPPPVSGSSGGGTTGGGGVSIGNGEGVPRGKVNPFQ